MQQNLQENNKQLQLNQIANNLNCLNGAIKFYEKKIKENGGSQYALLLFKSQHLVLSNLINDLNNQIKCKNFFDTSLSTLLDVVDLMNELHENELQNIIYNIDTLCDQIRSYGCMPDNFLDKTIVTYTEYLQLIINDIQTLEVVENAKITEMKSIKDKMLSITKEYDKFTKDAIIKFPIDINYCWHRFLLSQVMGEKADFVLPQESECLEIVQAIMTNSHLFVSELKDRISIIRNRKELYDLRLLVEKKMWVSLLLFFFVYNLGIYISLIEEKNTNIDQVFTIHYGL